MSNPAFDSVLDSMRQTHESKGHDYAEADNPYSNFEFAATVAGITVDQVFDTLIGVKIARLKVLNTAKEPKHESLADTRKDLAVYAALKASYPLWKTAKCGATFGQRVCNEPRGHAGWHRCPDGPAWV